MLAAGPSINASTTDPPFSPELTVHRQLRITVVRCPHHRTGRICILSPMQVTPMCWHIRFCVRCAGEHPVTELPSRTNKCGSGGDLAAGFGVTPPSGFGAVSFKLVVHQTNFIYSDEDERRGLRKDVRR